MPRQLAGGGAPAGRLDQRRQAVAQDVQPTLLTQQTLHRHGVCGIACRHAKQWVGQAGRERMPTSSCSLKTDRSKAVPTPHMPRLCCLRRASRQRGGRLQLPAAGAGNMVIECLRQRRCGGVVPSYRQQR